jgi:hypothetical protein
VKASIKAQLLSQKKASAMQAWLASMKQEFASEIHYAPGYAPASTATTTTAAPTTTG